MTESLEDRRVLAADIQLVADINQSPVSSSPGPFAKLGNNAVMVGRLNGTSNGGAVGLLLSDGTYAGTSLIASSAVVSSPNQLTSLSSFVYFQGTKNGDVELWRTDGTLAGTVLAANINATGSSTPDSLVAVGSNLYFSSTTTASGTELWKYDPATGQASLVKDINLTGNSSPQYLTNVNGELYFIANDGNGFQAWKSDGTSNGTIKLTTQLTGALAEPLFTAVGSKVFLQANLVSQGAELLVIDNGVVNTIIVNPGTTGATIQSPVASGGYLYFSAVTGNNGRELYRTDGTTTTVLTAALGNQSSVVFSGLPAIVPMGNGVVFLGGTPESGLEISRWTSDTGLTVLSDLTPGATGSNPTALRLVGTRAYFTATTPTYGTELWRTDGTTQGTQLVGDFSVGTANSTISLQTTIDSKLFARIGLPFALGTEQELLVVDDSALSGAVVQLSPINDGSNAGGFYPLGNRLLFAATDGTGTKPWVLDSNGTASLLANLSSNGGYRELSSNTLVFSATTTATGQELYRTDGTTAGTQLIADINLGTGSSSPQEITVFGNRAYFTATTTAAGRELWVSDGTSAGTTLLKDIATGTISSSATNFMAGTTKLYFIAATPDEGFEVWVTDGTEAGTRMTRDIRMGTASGSPGIIATLGDLAIFAYDDGVNGRELWVTDGTEIGTFMLRDIGQATSGIGGGSFTVAGNKLYFPARDTSVALNELWVTDGTTAGTKKVTADFPGQLLRQPDLLTVHGDRLYFSAINQNNDWDLHYIELNASTLPVNVNTNPSGNSIPSSLRSTPQGLYFSAQDGAGSELWRTDGTLAGTFRVADINPTGSSSPNPLVTIGDELIFIADDGVNGREYWRTDGTTAGTSLLNNHDNGPASPNSYSYTVFNGSFYFAQEFGIFNNELLRYTPGPSDLLITSTSILENSPANTLIGNLSTPQANSSAFTYALVAGSGATNNAQFSITGNQLFAISSFDYEATPSKTIRVRVTNLSGGSFEKVLTISVTDRNDPPTNLQLNGTSINENSPAGTSVGLLSVSDQDVADLTNFSLVNGFGDNARFVISGANLMTNAPINYELTPTLSVRVKAMDQAGAFVESTFTLSVVDIPEAPTDISLSSTNINENVGVGTQIGTLSSVDPDAGNTFTYSLVIGEGDFDNSKFAIDGDQLRSAATIDFESQSSYSIRVRTTDNSPGFTFERSFNITVNDVPEAPTDLLLSNNSVLDDAPAGTVVGQLNAVGATGATYSLVAGAAGLDNDRFILRGNNLRLIASPDYEVKTFYNVQLRATSAPGLFVDRAFVIGVVDQTESVSGLNWFDLNANGIQDAGEGGLAGWTIYADVNGNGVREISEPFTVSQTDNPATSQDETGFYTLPLTPGSYLIAREPSATPHIATFPTLIAGTLPQSFADSTHAVTIGSQSVTQLNFGNSPLRSVSFASASSTFDEGAGVVSVLGTLSSALGTELTVPVTIFSGTAGLSDYRVISTAMVFPAGSTQGRVDIEVIDDSRDEANESFTVTIAQTTAALLGATTSTNLTINDNDLAPIVRFATAAQTVAEGQSAIVSVFLLGETDQAVTVPILVNGFSTVSSQDFQLPSSTTITIPAGSRTGSLAISIVDDAVGESAEQLRLAFGTINGATASTVAGEVQHVIAIPQNDTPTVSFTQSGTSRTESSGSYSVAVSLTNAASQVISVPFLVGGSAGVADRTVLVNGTPLSGNTGNVTFNINERTKFITVQVLNDAPAVSEQNETVLLTLGTPNNNAIVGSSRFFTLTILDDDSPRISFDSSIATSRFEDSGTLSITVTSSIPSTVPMVIPIELASQNLRSSSGYALRTQDFSMPFSSITIQPGSLSASANLTLIDDTANESNEKIVLSLGLPSGDGILGSRTTHTLNVLDDDAAVSIKRSVSSLAEGNTTVKFTVSLDDATNQAVRVRLIPSGTATLGSDYSLSSGVTTISGKYYVDIPAGSTSRDVSVQVAEDSRDEENETITMSLEAVSGGVTVPKSTTSTITIDDDDAAPTVSFSTGDLNIYENKKQSTSITVKLSSASGKDVYVKPTFTSGSVKAVRNTDYTVSGLDSNGAIKIPAGSTSASFSIKTIDNARQYNRSFQIGLGTPTNAKAAKSSVLVTIVDNDPPALPQKAPQVSPPGTLAIDLNFDSYVGNYTIDSGLVGPVGTTNNFAIYPGTLAISTGGFLSGTSVFFDSNFNGTPDFLDKNGNGVLDEGEPEELVIITNSDGSFTAIVDGEFDADTNGIIDASEGRWVSSGGIDTSTHLPFEGRFFAPNGLHVFNPLSSVVAELVRQGLTIDDALPRMMEALNLPAIENFGTFNALASLQNGDALGNVYWTRNIQVYNAVLDIAKLLSGASAGLSVPYFVDVVFADMAERITSPESTLNLNNADDVANIIESAAGKAGLAITEGVRDGVAGIIADLNARLSAVISGASTLDYATALVKIKKVAQSNVANRLAEVGAGTVAIASAVAEFSGSNLDNLIAAATPGQIFPLKVGITDVQVTEGNSGTAQLVFSVQMQGENTGGVEVYYVIENESTNAQDYSGSSGSLTWAVGDTAPKTITLTVNGDTSFEPDELLKVVLSSNSNVVLTKPVGNGFIVNDDGVSYTTPASAPGSDSELTLELSELSTRIVQNGVEVSSGSYFNPLQVALTGQEDVNDTLVVNFDANTYRSDSVSFDGGGGIGNDSLKIVAGTFDLATHNLSTGTTILDPLGDVDTIIIQWSQIEVTELNSTTGSLSIVIPTGTTGILEDADPLQPGMMRLRPATGSFPSTLLRNPDATLTISGGSVTVASLDPAFTGTLVLPDNGAPSFTVGSPTDGFSGVVGQTRAFTFSTVSGAPTTYTYTIDWKDGSSPQTVVSGPGISSETRVITHQFLSAGTFTPTVRVSDSNNQESTGTLPTQTILASELQGTTLAIGGSAGADSHVIEPTSITQIIRVTNNGTPVSGGNQGVFNLFTLGATNVKVFAGAGNDALTFRGGGNNDVFTASATQLTGYGVNILMDSSIESVSLQGLGGNDSFTISDGASVSVDGGTGFDTLTSTSTSATAWTVSGINQGELASRPFTAVESLQGSDGAADTFTFGAAGVLSGSIAGGTGMGDILDLSASTSSINVNLATGTATNVQGGWSGIDSFAGNGNSLLGPNAAATWSITGVNAGSVGYGSNTIGFTGFKNVSGGTANDTFSLGALGQLQGTLAGGNGIDSLSLQANAAVSLATSSATGVGRFSSLESFSTSGTTSQLSAADVANTWSINDANAGSVAGVSFGGFARLVGGRLADSFVFGPAGSISGMINGFSGANKLDFSARTATVTVASSGVGPTAVVSGAGTLLSTFSQINSFIGSSVSGDVLVGPAASATWIISGTNAGTLGNSLFSGFESLQGGASTDTFTVLEGGSVGSINGGNGVDTLSAAGGANTWVVSGTASGSLNAIAYALVENLTGGTGDDIFDIRSTGRVAGILDDTGGFDTLSYATRTSGVNVNMASAPPSATGIATIRDVFELIEGSSSNDVIVGSATRSMVLLGGNGADQLIGGAQRDIVIGGLGIDQVRGGASDDIVIGDRLDVADTYATLKTIMQRWLQGDAYLDRVNALRSNLATTLSGPGSVKDDGVVDQVFGEAGFDWFVTAAADDDDRDVLNEVLDESFALPPF